MRLMVTVFSLYYDLLAKILHGFVKEENVAPLVIIRDGIKRGEFKTFAPIQLWWSILGMCMFTMQAREIAVRLQKEDLPWQAPSLAERKRQIIEILISGLAAGAVEGRPTPARTAATERVPPRMENGK